MAPAWLLLAVALTLVLMFMLEFPFPFVFAADNESVEFLREVAVDALAFFDLVLVPVMARLVPEPRFRFLITSVFKLRGLTTPWSFKNKPQALHKGCPSGFRLHRGVVCVKQLVHVVGPFPSP